MMRAARRNVVFRRYPGLNHSFRECAYGEEDCSSKPLKFSIVLKDLSTWLAGQ